MYFWLMCFVMQMRCIRRAAASNAKAEIKKKYKYQACDVTI